MIRNSDHNRANEKNSSTNRNSCSGSSRQVGRQTYKYVCTNKTYTIHHHNNAHLLCNDWSYSWHLAGHAVHLAQIFGLPTWSTDVVMFGIPIIHCSHSHFILLRNSWIIHDIAKESNITLSCKSFYTSTWKWWLILHWNRTFSSENTRPAACFQPHRWSTPMPDASPISCCTGLSKG